MINKPTRCDIFCAVVDNYGDAAVCWRLARQLAGTKRVGDRSHLLFLTYP